MIAFVRRQPVAAALAVGAVLLLAVIAVEARLGASLRANFAPLPKATRPAEQKLLPPVAVVAVEQAYPQTTARPLFTPTRRPAPPVEVAQQPAFVKGQFVLLGTTIAGNTRIALLKEKSNGRIHRVAKGEDVNGIKVAEVDPESVKMTQAGDSEVVALVVQKAVPGSANAALAGPFSGPAGAQTGFPIGTQGSPGAPPHNIMSAPPGTAPPTPVAPTPAVGQFGPLPTPAQLANQPGQAATPVQAQPTVPLTPEELLARRRARRAQQTQ